MFNSAWTILPRHLIRISKEARYNPSRRVLRVQLMTWKTGSIRRVRVPILQCSLIISSCDWSFMVNASYEHLWWIRLAVRGSTRKWVSANDVYYAVFVAEWPNQRRACVNNWPLVSVVYAPSLTILAFRSVDLNRRRGTPLSLLVHPVYGTSYLPIWEKPCRWFH